MTRSCIDCGGPISRTSKGRCLKCSANRMNADPEINARRRAAVAAHFAKPGAKQMRTESLRRWVETMPEDERERRRVNGRRLAAEVLSRPDVRQLSNSPEVKARAGRARTETVLGWCPPDLRDQYRALVMRKGIPAAEARKIIEAEIAGTIEHARRSIANVTLAQHLRAAREKAQAY